MLKYLHVIYDIWDSLKIIWEMRGESKGIDETSMAMS